MNDPYTCDYCGAHEVVPSLTEQHEAECVARVGMEVA